MPKQTLSKKNRLSKGRAWVAKYDGQHIVKGYRKHFGVDRLTAINDLHSLGVLDDAAYQKQLEQEEARVELVRRQRAEKKAAQWAELHKDQNDQFFYIVGYTSGGAPYGVTWEEMGLDPWEEIE